MKKGTQIVYSVIFLIGLIYMTTPVLAWDWDNVKTYEAKGKYGDIKIKNNFGLGGELVNHTLEKNDCSVIDCYAEGTSVLYVKDKLFSGVKLLDKNRNIKQRDIHIYIQKEKNITEETPIYSKTILANGTAKWSYNYTLYQTRTEKYYDEYNGEILEPSIYHWRIEGKRQPNEALDWVVTSMGQDLVEWAWWDSNWLYKRLITFPTFAENKTAKFYLPVYAGALANGNDLRFINYNENAELPFWIKAINSSHFTVYVFFNSSLTSNNATYLYYGNALASNKSNALGVAQYMATGLTSTETDSESARAGLGLKANHQVLELYGFGAFKSVTANSCYVQDGLSSILYTGNYGSQYCSLANQTAVISGNTSTYYVTFWNGGSALNRSFDGGTSSAIKQTENLNTTCGIYSASPSCVATYGFAVVNITSIRMMQSGFSSPTINTEQTQGTALTTSVTLGLPSTATATNLATIQFNATVNTISGNITNATIYIWNGGTFFNTLTLTGNTSNVSNWFISSLSEGSYTWNVYGCSANATATNCTFALTNNTLSIDRTAPNSVITPANKTYIFSNNYQNASLNITINTSGAVGCFYNLSTNATPVTINCNQTTLINLYNTVGAVTIYGYANDTLGNTNYNTTTISIMKATFNPTATILTSQAFELNITPLGSDVLTGYAFKYNQTSDTPSVVNDGAGNYIISNLFSIPINANGTNIFYWNITLSGGTMQNKIFNQTVSGMTIDNCAVGKFVVVNFSNYDQDTLTQLTTNNFYNLQLKLGDNQLTNYLQYANNFSNSTHATVCLDSAVGSSLRMDYLMQWNKNSSYETQYYAVQNQSFTNSSFWSNNISLYNILKSNSQVFQINVRDANYILLSGAVLKIDRQYIQNGIFRTAEAPLTDVLGSTTAHLILNNQIYNLYVYRNGELLGSFLNQQPYCNTLITDCVINYNLQSSGGSVIDIQNIVYYPTYNDTLRRYTVSFYTLDGLPTTTSLNGYYEDFGTSTNVCSDSSGISLGSLVCNIPSNYQNKTIKFVVDANGTRAFTDSVYVGYSDNTANLPNFRYLIAGILVATLGIMLASSGATITIGIAMFGLIVAGGFYLYDMSSWFGAGSLIVWVIIATGIIIIKISRSGD